MKFWDRIKKSLNYVPQAFGYTIKEWDTGYWQRNITYERKDVLCYHAVFACITLIASDISKLRIRLVRNDNGIWVEIPNDAYKVIDNPNTYQNRIQFYESWLNSKLIRGNAYIWKERDSKGNVQQMHVLHPDRVLPLVSDDGQVFYQLSQDNLAGIQEMSITIPSSEIIHDRFNCFFHPLVGLSPLFAGGLPAYMGIKALENSSKTFANGARPSGILTVPEAITAEKAAVLKDQWETNYGGENYGKTAILGGDVKYQALSMKAEEMQLVEQMKMTAQMVCSTFHVPPYKVGVGELPNYNNVQSLNLEYYNSALHVLIEAIELCLDEGLDIKADRGAEFDLDGLLRMDSKSQVETLGEGVLKAIFSPNEARRRMNLKAVDGGDIPFLQEQNWPINILSERKMQEPVVPAPANPTPPVQEPEKFIDMDLVSKHLECVNYAA